jgi:hypothetical protein
MRGRTSALLAAAALFPASVVHAKSSSSSSSTLLRTAPAPVTDPTPDQCAYETTAGCSAPLWEPRYAMRGSLYT